MSIRRKSYFTQFKVPILKGQVANNPEEAVKAAQSIGGNVWVGVKRKSSSSRSEESENRQIARRSETTRWQDHRHEPRDTANRVRGKKDCKRSISNKVATLKKNTTSRPWSTSHYGRIVMMAEKAWTLEEVAAETPHLIHKVVIDPAIGMQLCGAAARFRDRNGRRRRPKAVRVLFEILRGFSKIRLRFGRNRSSVQTGDGQVHRSTEN